MCQQQQAREKPVTSLIEGKIEPACVNLRQGLRHFVPGSMLSGKQLATVAKDGKRGAVILDATPEYGQERRWNRRAL
jgi:hypothetical protein